MLRITKTIELDIDQTVDCRVTLTSEDIKYFIRELDDNEAKEILDSLDRYPDAKNIQVSTVNDLLKMELLTDAFNKYSLTELEDKLK